MQFGNKRIDSRKKATRVSLYTETAFKGYKAHKMSPVQLKRSCHMVNPDYFGTRIDGYVMCKSKILTFEIMYFVALYEIKNSTFEISFA